MSGNRSLDEFGGVAEEGADSDPDEEPGGEAPDAAAPSGDDPPTAGDTIEPMAETFAWSGSGAECDACGETVTTRWRDGEGLVCEDCKAW